MPNAITHSVKPSKMRRFFLSPWLIWGLGAAFFFSEYFARVAPSVMVNDLMRDFQVNAVALGSLSAFFYYAYVSMQLPVGMLVDQYGPHRLLTITAIICACGAFMFAEAPDIYVADAGRLLMGFGAAFAFVGSLKLASVWFPSSRFGLLAGMTQALGMLGAAVGEAPMAITVNHLGWRHTMHLVGLVFIVLAVLIGFLVKDFPSDYPRTKIPTGKISGLFQSLVTVSKNPQSWWNALYVGMAYAPTAAFAELWGVSFLQHAYNVGTDVAAGAIGCIFIGWAVGGPVAGWLSDRIGKRKPIMFGSAAIGALLLVLIIYGRLPLDVVYVLLFVYGMSNTGVAISYALSSEINPRPIAGTSMALANMASVIVGASFQPIIGWFIDLQWNGVKVNGIPDYTVHDYRVALIVLPIFLVLSFIFCFFVKETHCRNLHDESTNGNGNHKDLGKAQPVLH